MTCQPPKFTWDLVVVIESCRISGRPRNLCIFPSSSLSQTMVVQQFIFECYIQPHRLKIGFQSYVSSVVENLSAATHSLRRDLKRDPQQAQHAYSCGIPHVQLRIWTRLSATVCESLACKYGQPAHTMGALGCTCEVWNRKCRWERCMCVWFLLHLNSSFWYSTFVLKSDILYRETRSLFIIQLFHFVQAELNPERLTVTAVQK